MSDDQRPPMPKKREGEFLRCPNCSGVNWRIGRITAECASCEYPVELDEAPRHFTGGVYAER